MHRELRELLTEAKGESQYVIAVNVDIRGFSAFSKTVESPDTATFIRRVYMTLIDEYFENASFFKPTGDGLLVTIPYDDKSLKDVVRATVDTCLKAIEQFPKFCDNDPMINFGTPQKIGIGMSRGTVCRLVSNGKTLDYSGRVVNLASRLMDLARPSGIVFDASVGIELLSEEQAKLFEKDSVYVRGISESKPITIYYTRDLTQISPQNKQPMDDVRWESIKDEMTLKQLQAVPQKFMYRLIQRPIDATKITLRVSFADPHFVRGKKRGIRRWLDYDIIKSDKIEYLIEKGIPCIYVRFPEIITILQQQKLKDSCKIEIEIFYPVKPS